MTDKNLTFSQLKDLVVTDCHRHPDVAHERLHGRFNNSRFGNGVNKNKSPKDYSKVAQRHGQH